VESLLEQPEQSAFADVTSPLATKEPEAEIPSGFSAFCLWPISIRRTQREVLSAAALHGRLQETVSGIASSRHWQTWRLTFVPN
jgi:hypothetical protein